MAELKKIEFGRAVEQYLAVLEPNRPGTARAYSSPLRRAAEAPRRYVKEDLELYSREDDIERMTPFLRKKRPGLGGRQVHTITSDDLIEMVIATRREIRSRRTGNEGAGAAENAISAYRAFFAWARDHNYTHSSPERHRELSSPRKAPKGRTALTPSALEKVMQVFDASADPELARICLRLALETGARHNELLQLRWGHLLIADGTVRLRPKAFGSKGEYHEVPVTASLFDALQSLTRNRSKSKVNDGTRVLLNRRGQPISRRYLEHLCEKVRIEHPEMNQPGSNFFTTHSLRHTAAHNVSRVGGPQVAIAFLGHSPFSRSHVDNYTRADITEVRATLAVIWGEPMAGTGHGFGRGEVHATRMLQLAALRDAEREQEDWKLRHHLDVVSGRSPEEPDPLEMEMYRQEDAERRGQEEALLERLFAQADEQ